MPRVERLYRFNHRPDLLPQLREVLRRVALADSQQVAAAAAHEAAKFSLGSQGVPLAQGQHCPQGSSVGRRRRRQRRRRALGVDSGPLAA